MINFDSTRQPSISLSPNSSISRIVSTRINNTDIRRYRSLLKLFEQDDSLIEDDDRGKGILSWINKIFCRWIWWIETERNGYIRLDESEPENEGVDNNDEGGERQQIEVEVTRYSCLDVVTVVMEN
jgi:hypothetical protein